MTQQIINVGAVANDRTGDSWRDAFIKVNANTQNFIQAWRTMLSLLIQKPTSRARCINHNIIKKLSLLHRLTGLNRQKF